MLASRILFNPAISTVFVLALVACSGDSDVPGSTGGRGGDASAGSGLGEPSTGVTPATTSSGGAVPGGSTGITVATSGGTTGRVPSGPSRDPIILDDCGDGSAAGLTPDQLAALKAGGGTPVRVLYPYDGTVFPRGLRSPQLMWDAGGASLAYVHISGELFDYQGCLPVTDGRVQVPQDVWDTAGVQTSTPYTLEITTLNGSQANGPASQTFVIAKGTLNGSIYYNSYNSRIASGLPAAEDLGEVGGVDLGGLIGGAGGAGGAGGFGGGGDGAVLRIRPGQDAELFAKQGSCTGCHSLSANGERMLTVEIAGGAFLGAFAGAAGLTGPIYEIGPDTMPNPPALRTEAAQTSFGALTPDGRFYLGSGSSAGYGPPLTGSQAPPQTAAVLYETDTGTVVSGTGIPESAMMPTFSPDGTLLVFNDYAVNNGRSLTLMDFDLQNGVASNARVVYTHDSLGVGWPFMLPDNRGVVFAVTASVKFSGESSFIGASRQGPYSELLFLNLESGETNLMARAMGYGSLEDAAAGATYLPFGAEEIGQVYYPTVSPIAAGGYFWVFFDVNRHYGNTGMRRQIWGAAIRIPHSEEFNQYEPDPSRPAFYLDGQELDVANHRAFTVLDPCKEDGQSCETGVDCCSGFCTDGVCGYQEPRCSEIGEACETADDCCDDDVQCINGFCATVLI